MTEAEIRALASTAAREAVKEVFSLMRVDPADIDSVVGFTDDLRYLRRQREAAEKISFKAVAAIFTTAVTGAGALVWLGLQDFFTR
ncbi:hypothetical protein ASD54_08665 [Rhizobium sp. Root149]|uniref:hypothetical protein n=1 Tax=Rhizobium sp. Root149 TaxID=1736473 RepID=UPI0007143DFE|nr:hypothetical protein [Rhizobium sp. Root149]KQZ50317.1 hypothetical protein ASD54_08665 [Rhizobium sp. Root149]